MLLSVYSESLYIGDAALLIILGIGIVFIVLIFLYLLIRTLKSAADIFERVSEASAEPVTSAAPALPCSKTPSVSAGAVAIYKTEIPITAMLLAITAEATGIPLAGLKIISVQEKQRSKKKVKNDAVKAADISLGKKYSFNTERIEGDTMKYSISLNEKTYIVEVEKGEVSAEETAVAPLPAPITAPAPIPVPKAASAQDGARAINSPLPGNILAVNVAQNAKVVKGQLLMIIEAMKMENEILSPCDGIVANITVSVGSAVSTGDLLISIIP